MKKRISAIKIKINSMIMESTSPFRRNYREDIEKEAEFKGVFFFLLIYFHSSKLYSFSCTTIENEDLTTKGRKS